MLDGALLAGLDPEADPPRGLVELDHGQTLVTAESCVTSFCPEGRTMTPRSHPGLIRPMIQRPTHTVDQRRVGAAESATDDDTPGVERVAEVDQGASDHPSRVDEHPGGPGSPRAAMD
jgi:hypothetical protein